MQLKAQKTTGIMHHLIAYVTDGLTERNKPSGFHYDVSEIHFSLIFDGLVNMGYTCHFCFG